MSDNTGRLKDVWEERTLVLFVGMEIDTKNLESSLIKHRKLMMSNLPCLTWSHPDEPS